MVSYGMVYVYDVVGVMVMLMLWWRWKAESCSVRMMCQDRCAIIFVLCPIVVGFGFGFAEFFPKSSLLW